MPQRNTNVRMSLDPLIDTKTWNDAFCTQVFLPESSSVSPASVSDASPDFFSMTSTASSPIPSSLGFLPTILEEEEEEEEEVDGDDDEISLSGSEEESLLQSILFAGKQHDKLRDDRLTSTTCNVTSFHPNLSSSQFFILREKLTRIQIGS